MASPRGLELIPGIHDEFILIVDFVVPRRGRQIQVQDYKDIELKV